MEYVIVIAALILFVVVEFRQEIGDVLLAVGRLIQRVQELREKAAMRAYWAAKDNRIDRR
jgi:NTP pyrophosphatase (non-canonical NTP hydrolase)